MIRYVTRWALSTGIRAVEGEVYVSGSTEYWTGQGIFVRLTEAHETLDEAIACAKKMAKKRAAKLRAQADKLSDPTWEPKIVRAEPKP